jgi:hypothetical protein
MTTIPAPSNPFEQRASLRLTSAGVDAAHDAVLHRSLRRARWERRGLLGRLVRSDAARRE